MEREEVLLRLKGITKRAKSKGATDEEILACLKAKGYSRETSQELSPYQRSLSLLNCLLFKVYPIVFALALLAYPIFKMMTGSPCLLIEISPFGEAVTPVVNCESVCVGVTEAPRLTNLSKDNFIRNYAYTSKPILVVGAVSNWSALDVFSYDYFKSIYTNAPESLTEDTKYGQFFSYSSDIKDLKELFSLPSDVAAMKKEKWYIGW